MTLSRFITTYLFTPLVRAMPSMNFIYTMLATFLAMFIAGIWHGNGLTFVIYGALHGGALVVNHWWKKRKKKLPAWLAWALTFNFINLTFIIFRAPKFEMAWNLIQGLVGANGVIFPKIGIKPETLQNLGWKVGTYLYPDDYLLLAMLLGCFWMVFKTSNSMEIEKRLAPNYRWAILGGMGFALALFGMNRITEFIYFNF
jgi:alginate O-acetyltransferase complex protein AlgI